MLVSDVARPRMRLGWNGLHVSPLHAGAQKLLEIKDSIAFRDHCLPLVRAGLVDLLERCLEALPQRREMGNLSQSIQSRQI